MPVVNGQGKSVATRYKQFALNRNAGHMLGSAVAVARRFGVPCFVCDMTTGRGHDNSGAEGSPLILARHIVRLMEMHQYPITPVFVDHDREAIQQLHAVMDSYFPGLAVEYSYDQSEALESVPNSAYGLTYWDPNGYSQKRDGLDARLLMTFSQSHKYMDVLITRECLAGYRMQCAAHCKDTLTIQDYLALTGKKRNYILPYADYHWWSLGFADNWVDRPASKMHGWVDVQSTEGPKLFAKWTKGMQLEPKEKKQEQAALW